MDLKNGEREEKEDKNLKWSTVIDEVPFPISRFKKQILP